MAGFFAGIGGVVWIVMTALALLMPVMVYLIQRNTCQTRDELRNLNRNIETLTKYLAEQASTPKANTPQPSEQSSSTVTMTCDSCGKIFKYGINHSGTYKPCPGCHKKILLK